MVDYTVYGLHINDIIKSRPNIPGPPSSVPTAYFSQNNLHRLGLGSHLSVFIFVFFFVNPF